MSALKAALAKVPATEPRFWSKVATKVGRSATECHEIWFENFKPKETLGQKEQKRNEQKAQRRVDKAEAAIHEAARAATTFEATSAEDQAAAKKARAKLRRALKDLKSVDVPKKPKDEVSWADDDIDLDKRMRRIASPQHQPPKKQQRRRRIKSPAEDDDDDDDEEDEAWRPGQGYLAALRKKRPQKPKPQPKTFDDRRDLKELKQLQKKINDIHDDADDSDDDPLCDATAVTAP